LARASACHAEGRGFESHQPLCSGPLSDRDRRRQADHHPARPETTDALKEIDRAAMADAETDEQVVGVLRYLLEGKLPAAG
jgi:hypothetical protein